MGDGMKVTDLVASGHDPLRGPNGPSLGGRIVSMNQAYDPALIPALPESGS